MLYEKNRTTAFKVVRMSVKNRYIVKKEQLCINLKK